MSTLITLNSSNVSNTQNNIYTFNFPTGSVSLKNSRVALQSIIIPYSWYNVSGTVYNNNTFQITMPVTIGGSSTQQTINITIPQGFYSLDQINQVLQAQLLNSGYYLINASNNNVFYIEIVINLNLNCAQINSYVVPTSKPATWSYGTTGTWGASGVGSLPLTANQVPQIIISSNNFGKLIGFNSGTYPSSTTSTSTVSTSSQNMPQITPVTSVYVGCSLVRNVYSNPTSIIGNIGITSNFATQIIYSPNEFTWLPVLEGTIPSFSVIFYDQLFNNLAINDTNLTINLLIELNQ